MAVKSDNTLNGSESTRSDSIGCSEAYKELQESSSVELLRNSIFRSISKMRTIPKIPDIQPKSRYSQRKAKSDLSLSNIEVKFLEKYSSMDSRSQIQSINKNDVKQLSTQPPNIRQMDLNRQNISNPVLDIGKSKKLDVAKDSSITQKTTDTQLSDCKVDAKENSETEVLGKNSLKLVFRTSNNTIFEDCSTYNINCNEVFMPETSNCFGKESNSSNCGSEIQFGDREKLLEDGFFIVEPDRSPEQQYELASEDQPSLCDTFFSKVNSGDYAAITNNSMQKPIIKKLTVTKPSENKEIAVAKDGEVKQEDAVDGSSEISKFSRRIRKRNRKSQSNEPHVYECPQCGVSYTISTDMVNDAAYCLHCDLWTSVEPEFLKREKQQWNTCRIC